MNTYTIVDIKGVQFKVLPGSEIDVPLLAQKAGEKVQLDKVLLTVKDEKIEVGTPYVSTKKLTATVVSQGKGPKIKISKYKAKSRYQKETGFRQKLSRIKVENF